MEIIIVIILIGIIAGFAIPNYSKSIRKTNEREMITQLCSIHAANIIYKSQARGYFNYSSGDLGDINTGLGLNILANGLSYTYNGDDTSFTVVATSSDFAVRINELPLSSTNPCCDRLVIDNVCPSLTDC